MKRNERNFLTTILLEGKILEKLVEGDCMHLL